MKKIDFKNDKTTPITADVLNELQNNVENDLGLLSNLQTSSKSNLVNAINSLIIEESKNSNGHYIKFANGILICMSEIEKTINVNAALGNGFYYGVTISNKMPCEFTEIFYDDINVVNEHEIWATQYYSSTSDTWSSRIDFYSFAKKENIPVKVRYFAVGKWNN